MMTMTSRWDDSTSAAPSAPASPLIPKKNPEEIRALARQYLDTHATCAPRDLRRAGVRGGSVELNNIIGEARSQRDGARPPVGTAISAAARVTPSLPAEFRRVEATWHQAVTSYASRVHGEAHERVEHAIARVKEEASAAADAMVVELAEVRTHAAAFAEAVETSEARCALAVESESRLHARVGELLEHQRTLQDVATDLRSALTAEQEAHRVDAGERDVLRAKLRMLESSLAEAESTNRELRDVVRTTHAETATLRSALTAGNEALAALHRSVEQVVKTNATLVERRAKKAATTAVGSRRTAKPTR